MALEKYMAIAGLVLSIFFVAEVFTLFNFMIDPSDNDSFGFEAGFWNFWGCANPDRYGSGTARHCGCAWRVLLLSTDNSEDGRLRSAGLIASHVD